MAGKSTWRLVFGVIAFVYGGAYVGLGEPSYGLVWLVIGLLSTFRYASDDFDQFLERNRHAFLIGLSIACAIGAGWFLSIGEGSIGWALAIALLLLLLLLSYDGYKRYSRT